MSALNPRHPSLFDAVIAPMDRETFIARHWGTSYLHVPGEPQRFHGVLSWDALNSLLESHSLQALKLRLSQGGRLVPQEKYTFRQGAADTSTLNPASLSTCLAAGATMILDHVDEFAPGPRRIAMDYERALRTHASINLYASWCRQPGFDLHWDGQDTFILQLEGRKRWSVYAPTMQHPLKGLDELPRRPDGPPAWEGLLAQGDMLYLPRGWWHGVSPIGEPSLHLTVSLEPVHGGDLLAWLVDQLLRRPAVRERIPRLGAPAQIDAYMRSLRASLLEEWTDDLASRYLEALDAHAIVRPEFRLPESVTANNAPLGPATRLRPASPNGLSILPSLQANLIEVHSLGRRLQAPQELAPVLTMLDGVRAWSVQELCDRLPPEFAPGRLMVVLAQLLLAGIIVQE